MMRDNIESQDSQIVPLSYAQQALWLNYQIIAESRTAYNIAFAARIHSRLDISALQRACQSLVDRHPLLRANFIEQDGEPVQIIHSYKEVSFEVTDASSWTWDALKQQAIKNYRQPFDLAQDSLLRVSLFERSEEDCFLLLTLDHIICDGWSFWLLLDELPKLYAAQSSRVEPDLPPLNFSYSDYIDWQSAMLTSPEGEKHWHYWQKQLQGELPVLNLPTDRIRPPVQTYRGASVPFQITPELTQRLKDLAAAEKSTLNMVLLAAFQVLLYRYTGQEDLVVGSPTRGRGRPKFAQIFGLLVNHVVLRSDLSGNPTFKAFLQQVRRTVAYAIAHQDYPFALLVEKLQPERDLSRLPLFQVSFVLQKPQIAEESGQLLVANQAGIKVNWGGLSLESFELAQYEGLFDLNLEVIESKDCLLGAFKYNTDLFDVSTIERMAAHWQNLLKGIVADPEQSIAQLPILSPAERHQLLVEWNDTQTDYSLDKCLHQLFEEQVERTPDAIAVVFEGQQLTYRELNSRANQLAHYLQALGIKPDGLVGICIERSLEMVVGLLGILKAGGAYVPLDPSYPPERLAFTISDAQVSVLLTTQELVTHLPEHQAQVLCLDKDWAAIAQGSDENPDSGVKSDNLAYVIYTSGSTGQPKGCLIAHQNVTRLFAATQSWFHFDRRDVWTLFHSYAFDFSVWELWGALLYGGRLVVVPYWVSRSPEAFYDLLCDQGVTVLNQTPSAFRQLIRAEEELPAPQELSLRLVIFGGEALELQSLKPWFERHGEQMPQLVNMYGITETTVHVTYRPLSLTDLNSAGSVIGIPIPDLQVYILDGNLQPVPIGVPGEMYVGGAGVARGYLNRPELTAERFITNPFSSKPDARLYESGDLARYLANGDIEYLGRIDHQVKIRGFRIELGEIESALISHPEIRTAVVLDREDSQGDKQLVAYVVPVKEVSGLENLPKLDSIKNIRDYLSHKLPNYMIPRGFILLEAIPLTPNGKLDRRALPTPDSAVVRATDDSRPPQTLTEQLLSEIWTEVLGVENIGIRDNFFELGGDSIISLRIVAKAHQKGLKLTPKQIMQYQTLGELAAVAIPEEVAPITQGAIAGTSLLTPIQYWFFEQSLVNPHHYNQALLLEVPPDLQTQRVQQVLQQLIAHHDALRLNFEQQGGQWQATHSEQEKTIPLTVVDLSHFAPDDQEANLTTIAGQWQARLNFSDGPLMQVVLFQYGVNQPGRLLWIIHHLVVDGVSWRILLDDFATAYDQLTQGQPIQLPAKTTAFKTWAETLRNYAHSADLEKEKDYWLALSPTVVTPFPRDYPADITQNLESSAAQVRVWLESALTEALLYKVPGIYHTQMNDILLTALVQCFVSWTKSPSLLLDLESHGRNALGKDIDLSRTVGWFTSLFPVFLDLSNAHHPGEAIKEIKECLRRIPNDGISYGLLRYLSQDGNFRQIPKAEVVFNYLGQFDATIGKDCGLKLAQETIGGMHDPNSQRTHLIEINGWLVSNRLRFDWIYSDRIHRQTTIEGLANHFIEQLQALIAHCQSPEVGGYTPSDFPAANVNQRQLDKLMTKLKKTK